MTSPRRVFIIGGGPSLRSFDWSLLEGEVVLALNAAALHLPEGVGVMSALFVQDRRAVDLVAASPAALRLHGRCFCPAFYADTSKPELPVGWKQPLGERAWIVGAGARVLWSSHAGPAALNMARQLWPEAGTFYLLGFDYGSSGGIANFHGHYLRAFPEDEKLPQDEDAKRWKAWRLDFERAVARVREDGVRVVNLSPFSMIHGAEWAPLEAVLGAIA